MRTHCQAPYGYILGGQLTGQKGTVSTKTFTDLPKHMGVVISMTFLYVWLCCLCLIDIPPVPRG